jgi:hypothetical protein
MLERPTVRSRSRLAAIIVVVAFVLQTCAIVVLLFQLDPIRPALAQAQPPRAPMIRLTRPLLELPPAAAGTMIGFSGDGMQLAVDLHAPNLGKMIVSKWKSIGNNAYRGNDITCVVEKVAYVHCELAVDRSGRATPVQRFVATGDVEHPPWSDPDDVALRHDTAGWTIAVGEYAGSMLRFWVRDRGAAQLSFSEHYGPWGEVASTCAFRIDNDGNVSAR